MRPIKPSEVSDKKSAEIPDEIISVFNELIVKYWNGKSSMFTQDELLTLVLIRMEISSKRIFDEHLFDVGDLYSKEGWKVKYDSPGMGETFKAFFEFTK